jgi:tetratricopeptide (TPR) repeat protein
VALERQEKWVELEATNGQAIDLAPTDAAAHLNLGVDLDEQEMYKQAERAYRKSIELQPNYALARCNLAHLLRRAGFPEAAKKEVERARKNDPTLLRIKSILAEIDIDLGDETDNLNYYTVAIREIDDLLSSKTPQTSQERQDNLPNLYLQRGYAYAKLGKISKAIDDFNQCLELRSIGPTSHGDPFSKARDNLRAIKESRKGAGTVPKWLPYALGILSLLQAGMAIVLLFTNRLAGANFTALLIASFVGAFVAFFFPHVTKLKFADIAELEKEISGPVTPTSKTSLNLEAGLERLSHQKILE